MNYMIGNCSLCKIEKPLPALRDGYIICADCNKTIEKDLAEFNTIECQRCFNYFSPIFINSDYGEPWCKNCEPGGVCGICHQEKKLPYVSEIGFLCEDCKDR